MIVRLDADSVATLENIPGVEDMTFYCEGSTDIDGHKVTCMENHGTLTLMEAFSHSCNIAFAQLSDMLGKDKLEKYDLSSSLFSSVEKIIWLDDDNVVVIAHINPSLKQP